MENFWARQSLDAAGSDNGSQTFVDGFDGGHPDDPLGDEAAFPSTWQHLSGGDAPRD